MEYVEGMSLADALSERRAPFTVAEALPWMRDLASALDYAHAQGVLHRDVKPANVLLSKGGQVHLADFGIARLAQELNDAPGGAQPATGTIFFMSPEQVSGGAADPRSDLYSLAASMYLLLSGLPPFYEGEVLSQEQLAEALIVQRQSGGKLGAVLIAQGRLSESALTAVLSEQLRTSTTRVTDGEIDPAIARTLPRETAERHLALPMKRTQFGVLVAMADPLDMEALNRLEETFGETIEPLVATETDVRAAIARVYAAGA